MSFQTRRIREEKPPRPFPWRKAAALAVTIASPLLGIVRAWREKRAEDARRVRLLKRLTIILLSLLLCLLLLAGVTRALVQLRILNLSGLVGAAASPLPADENGFTNVLLLGKGDQDHDGVDLTDTLMVASIDPKTRSIVLLSIPRDLHVTSETMGRGRINALYRDYKGYLRRTRDLDAPAASREALKALTAEVGMMLRTEIHHAVMVNFRGFVEAVDALGGVEIDVPEDIVDTQYPGPDYTYETFEIRAGNALLDGATALKYARSRHSTSDFGRSARQQQILQALGDRAKTLGVLKSPRRLLALLRILSENVETTMTAQELLGAAQMAQGLDRDKVVSMQLSDRSGFAGSLPEAGGFLYAPPREEFGGASVLLPDPLSPSDRFGRLRAFTRLLFTRRELYLPSPRIAVRNAGTRPGMAMRLANELARFGFAVEDVGNATVAAPDGASSKERARQERSFLIPQTEEDRDAAAAIAGLLGLPVEELPAWLPAEEQQQITIVLGEDYTFTPLATLLQEKAPSAASDRP